MRIQIEGRKKFLGGRPQAFASLAFSIGDHELPFTKSQQCGGTLDLPNPVNFSKAYRLEVSDDCQNLERLVGERLRCTLRKYARNLSLEFWLDLHPPTSMIVSKDLSTIRFLKVIGLGG